MEVIKSRTKLKKLKQGGEGEGGGGVQAEGFNVENTSLVNDLINTRPPLPGFAPPRHYFTATPVCFSSVLL